MLYSRVLRGLVVALAAAVIVVAVAACGGGGGPSQADPAAAVPASAVVYVAVKVPSSGALTQFRTIVTDFAGAGAWNTLSSEFNGELKRNGFTWKKNIAPWIGSQVGLAITGLPAGSSDFQNIALVFPTNHMKQALAFAKQANKGGSSDAIYAQDGKYMLVGDAASVAALKAAGAKLSSTAQYQAVSKPVSSDNAISYLNLHTLLGALETSISAAGGSESAALDKYLTSLPTDASVGLGFGVGSKVMRFDVIPHDIPATGSSADVNGGGTVAGLPSDSILAAALDLKINPNGTSIKQLLSALGQSGSSGLLGALSGSAPANRDEQKAASLIESLATAFGPLKFALGGTSLLGLHGGLSMTSSNPRSAATLLSTLFSAIKRDTGSGSSVSVVGTAKAFSVVAGPFKIEVSDQAGQVVALLNEAGTAALLSPASKLSSAGAYKSAAAQLSSGNRTVPFYLSFQGLDSLLGSLLSDDSDAQDQQVLRVLKQLSYLIVGAGPSDLRIAVGLR